MGSSPLQCDLELLASRQQLVNGLQFLARLESHCLARRNRDFRARPRIPANPGLSRAHIEYAESAQFNAVAGRERLLHTLKDGFNGELSFGFGNPGAIDHFVDDVELNHGRLPSPLGMMRINTPQVIDAKEDRSDCQPALLSRKMTAPA